MMLKIYPKRINIRVAMAYKGLNQKELSKISEINPSTFSNFMNGRYSISSKSAKKIARTLEKPVKELFDFK
ncbi:helix-turn-helix transcriptional regulator [Psychrobacillus sp. Sa2BUA9]|uniref:Helix-turn-helix transcriptional regulator n=1 Tax=Psychrobacillus faecigallinarum TaxID=2762235 RepID=A0ABR8RBU7_9BACI|nr:helix-turn-helix transcriptional regulator [Psychrobacillus faecigallinarum]MBD7945273.1 helix-turn-helix transcriptional regulator [Psychrobacillus faecigallinarum]